MALKASPRQHLRQLQLQLLNVVDPSRITAIVGPIFSANLHVPVLFFIQENSLLGAAYQQISVLNTQFGPQTWKQQIHANPSFALMILMAPWRLAHLYTELTMARTEAASIKAEKEQLEAEVIHQADPTALKSINQQLYCEGWSWWWR